MDGSKFIYVFTKSDKDRLCDMGYIMMKSDNVNDIYIFLNQEEQNFATAISDYALSDTISF